MPQRDPSPILLLGGGEGGGGVGTSILLMFLSVIINGRAKFTNQKKRGATVNYIFYTWILTGVEVSKGGKCPPTPLENAPLAPLMNSDNVLGYSLTWKALLSPRIATVSLGRVGRGEEWRVQGKLEGKGWGVLRD